jgi:NAD(P)-dependent dehydrogenase (short-subunit alcohol dehydrogenase family)
MNTPMAQKSVAEAYSGGNIEKMIAVRNSQVPMGKQGDAWDVAYAALFLASEEAKYITGTQLVVDGGLTSSAVSPP